MSWSVTRHRGCDWTAQMCSQGLRSRCASTTTIRFSTEKSGAHRLTSCEPAGRSALGPSNWNCQHLTGVAAGARTWTGSTRCLAILRELSMIGLFGRILMTSRWLLPRMISGDASLHIETTGTPLACLPLSREPAVEKAKTLMISERQGSLKRPRLLNGSWIPNENTFPSGWAKNRTVSTSAPQCTAVKDLNWTLPVSSGGTTWWSEGDTGP